jgi:hypothetical protein
VTLGVAGAINVYAKIDNGQSLELIQRAQALNPHYPRLLHYGACLIYLDRGEDARALAELDAQDVRSHFTDPLLRAAFYCRASRLSEARAEAERVVQLYPHFPTRGFGLLARYHHRDYLEAIYQRLAPLNLPWTPPPPEQSWLSS